ncbi:MAG: hypothetical protein LKF41_04230 [Bifidobacterium sp.]|nr:hypothetical protein [Bifidobacterium sp.]MCH4175052.1 hypothetical protein [Bifidobacterium sp.]
MPWKENAVRRGFQGAVLDVLGAKLLDLTVIDSQLVSGDTLRRITFSSATRFPDALHEAASGIRLWFPLASGRAV